MSAPPGANLLPGFEDPSWRTWSASPAQAPVFSRKEMDRGVVVTRIETAGDRRRYGGWRCDVQGVAGGESYAFEVEYLPEAIEDELVSLYALLSWSDPDGRLLTREYANGIRFLDNGRRVVWTTIEAPSAASAVRIDLVLRWTRSGSVLWSSPRLARLPGRSHRRIRVATTYLTQRREATANLAALLAVVDRAGEAGSDVIVLGENFVDRGAIRPETIPGPLTELLAARAARHRAYVVVALNECRGEYLYKSAVLLDRSGAIVGKYCKTHLPLCEAEEGAIPGEELPVFRTDFGTVGILICWDQCYPEPARILRLKGAEIVFIPTIGDSPVQSMARAADNAIPVVVAGADGPRPSRIIDSEGAIVGDIPNGRDDICVREIDLDERRLRRWMSVGDADGDPRNLFMRERRPDIYGALAFDGRRQPF